MSDLIGDDDLHAHFYRSPVAHGVLIAVDVDSARDMPGVDLVQTCAELDLAPIGGGAHAGEGRFERPLLATGKVRYVGDPIALVLAGPCSRASSIPRAAIDALRRHGVSDLQMPLRTHRVWEAIRGASAGGN